MSNTTQKSRIGLTALATCCAIALGMTSTSAMAFVDRDHSAEGVKSSATMYKGSGSKSGGFVDYSHSAESVRTGPAPTTGNTTASTGGFIDRDHSAEGVRS